MDSFWEWIKKEKFPVKSVWEPISLELPLYDIDAYQPNEPPTTKSEDNDDNTCDGSIVIKLI